MAGKPPSTPNYHLVGINQANERIETLRELGGSYEPPADFCVALGKGPSSTPGGVGKIWGGGVASTLHFTVAPCSAHLGPQVLVWRSAWRRRVAFPIRNRRKPCYRSLIPHT